MGRSGKAMRHSGKRGKAHKEGFLAKETMKDNVKEFGYDSDLEAEARRLEAEAELLALDAAQAEAAQEEVAQVAAAQAAQEEVAQVAAAQAAQAAAEADDEAAGGAAEDGAAAMGI